MTRERKLEPLVMVLEVDRDQARRFLVRRHLLDPPRALPASLESVLAVVERLGSLQFDPLVYTGARNHDLVLHARIARHVRESESALLYAPMGERRLFEAYNKALSLLPTSELPWHRAAWTNASARHRGGILKAHAKVARAILAKIDADGPLSTGDADVHGGTMTWGWGTTRVDRAVLEALFITGKIGIARRDGNRRYYDRVERIFPRELLDARISARESLRHRLLSRHRGVGLLGESGNAEVFLGTDVAAKRRVALASLVRDGALVPVAIEGVRGTRYVLASERATLDAGPLVSREATFLAPLDPLLWDRGLVRALFDFDYKWEVYTPRAQRKFGYYALPILFGDRLVGRVEPRFDRDRRELVVEGLWLERGTSIDREGLAPAIARAMAAHAELVGADRVIWPKTKLAQAVARA